MYIKIQYHFAARKVKIMKVLSTQTQTVGIKGNVIRDF